MKSLRLLSLKEAAMITGGKKKKKSSWYKESYGAGKAYGTLARDFLQGITFFI